MLPLIIAAAGAYLIGDSVKKFADGGGIDYSEFKSGTTISGLPYKVKETKYGFRYLIQGDGSYYKVFGEEYKQPFFEFVTDKKLSDKEIDEAHKNPVVLNDIYDSYNSEYNNPEMMEYADGGVMAKGGVIEVGDTLILPKDMRITVNGFKEKISNNKHIPTTKWKVEELYTDSFGEEKIRISNSKQILGTYLREVKLFSDYFNKSNKYADGGVMAKGGGIKGTYTGKIVETEIGEVMIGKISGHRGNGEPVYDTHEFGGLRKDMRGKVGELSNSKIKELLKNKK